MKRFKRLFVIMSICLLTGCGGPGVSSWDMTGETTIITKDPKSIPGIAWQTDRQRQTLLRQQPVESQTQEKSGFFNSLAPKKDHVTVALIVPMTGKNAALGQAMLNAAQLALFDIGSAGFELMPIDTRDNPQGAAAAAEEAVSARADMILGPIFADDVRAVKPIAASAGIPVLSFTTDWTLAGNDTYVMGFFPFSQIARAVQYAKNKGVSRFAAYSPETEYGDVAIATLNRTGASVVRVGRYPIDRADMSPLVERFAAAEKSTNAEGETVFDFDALLLPLGGEGLRSLVSVLDRYELNNKKVRFIGTGLWDDDSLTRNPALYGGWFAAPDPALRRDFERRYEKTYNEPPQRLASLAYDATALAALLARTAKDGEPYSRERLTHPRGFAGIDGIFRFRADGLTERGLAVLEIQQGRARVVDPAPTAFIPGGGS